MKIYVLGDKLHDMRLLHAEQSSSNWVNHVEYQQQIISKKPRKYHLQKLSTNKIVEKPSSDSSMALKNQYTTVADAKEEFKTSISAINAITDGNLPFMGISDSPQTEIMQGPKTIYNHTIDAFKMVENRKGFLDTQTINLHETLPDQSRRFRQIYGVYCIRWRRAGDISENESKFIINSIEIVEAPLNIYCYLDEKMYVKVPMTLRITLKNTTNSTLPLKSFLKNADNFMFAGHSQVCQAHKSQHK